ncbi:transglutaminase family protein, partial [Mesorhizobium sp. M4B.F.Ca.ET.019.03.1.1]
LYDAVVEDSGEPDEVNTLAGETPVAELPDDALVYLLGSRYCETDHLSDLAWQLFGNLPPGWARAQAIVDYVHSRLSFGYGYARATRTAAQAHEERVGVCRDFAHLAITLCRAMNIPARYVNGYLGDIGVPVDPAPMDFSAWIEVFLDGKWYAFDPRHNIPRIGRIVIARGRDATDVPLLHSFGPHRLTLFKVWTYEQERNLFSPPHHGLDRTASARMLA